MGADVPRIKLSLINSFWIGMANEKKLHRVKDNWGGMQATIFKQCKYFEFDSISKK